MNTLRYLKTVELQMELTQFYSSDAAKAIFGNRTAGPQGFQSRYLNGTGDGNMLANVSIGRDSLSHGLLHVTTAALQTASPVYIAPWMEELLDDSLGSFPGDSYTFRAEDLPTPHGFVFIDTEDGHGWPVETTPSGFEQEIKCILWSLDAGKNVALWGFGPSTKPDSPEEGDELAQLVWTDIWHVGDSVGALPDGFAEALEAPDREDSYTYIAAPRPDHPSIYYKHSTMVHAALKAEVDRQIQVRTYAAVIWAFMRQKIAAVRSVPVDRATRRRMERVNWANQLVQVVELRAREAGTAPRKGEEERTPISVRYIRRMHWHSYWCEGKRSKECTEGKPHERRLEPRLLEATVCGPETAPLKTGTKLFSVVR